MGQINPSIFAELREQFEGADEEAEAINNAIDLLDNDFQPPSDHFNIEMRFTDQNAVPRAANVNRSFLRSSNMRPRFWGERTQGDG